MADAPAPATVSPSRPPGSETPRRPPSRRDDSETGGKTLGLKALAHLVIARDTRRDAARDSPSRPAMQTERSPEAVSTGETAAATWGEAEDKRAVIVEYGGAVPREWAEGFARLDPDKAPSDVPPQRWRRFIDDTCAFLDRWAAQASALGWLAHDLFGCDRDRPFARIDQAGLLWLLNGDRLVILTAETATIETTTGARQIWGRKPNAAGRLLAWELVP